MRELVRERSWQRLELYCKSLLFTLGAMGGAQYDTKYSTVGAASGNPLIKPPVK